MKLRSANSSTKVKSKLQEIKETVEGMEFWKYRVDFQVYVLCPSSMHLYYCVQLGTCVFIVIICAILVSEWIFILFFSK